MPSITPKKLLKALRNKGFYIHHQVGSHIILKSSLDITKRVSLPMHNKDLKQGTLSSILKQAGIGRDELSKRGQKAKRNESSS
jgi:predicted RNA binding protein YcfA (HicA-like mRNA interferase family)